MVRTKTRVADAPVTKEKVKGAAVDSAEVKEPSTPEMSPACVLPRTQTLSDTARINRIEEVLRRHAKWNNCAHSTLIQHEQWISSLAAIAEQCPSCAPYVARARVNNKTREEAEEVGTTPEK